MNYRFIPKDPTEKLKTQDPIYSSRIILTIIFSHFFQTKYIVCLKTI